MTAWLLTWLWQGTALAVTVTIALHLLPRIDAAARFIIWWGALLAVLCLGWQASPHLAPAVTSILPLPTVGVAVEVAPFPSWAITVLMTLWTSVALFRLLRVFPGLNHLYRLKDECRPFPAAVEAQLPLWLESGGRGVRLMMCDALSSAAVLGLHDPFIAVPSALVGDLSAADLDQIILHEYGHVQRRDDWTRLLQTLLEAAFWIHPAVFLIGRQLDLEREVACDDWVIARTGSPRIYASCLARVAERGRSRRGPSFAPALFGGNRDLFVRVDRLLNARRVVRRSPSLAAVATALSVIGVFALHAGAFPLVTEAVTPIVIVTEALAAYAPAAYASAAGSPSAVLAVAPEASSDEKIVVRSRSRHPLTPGRTIQGSPVANQALPVVSRAEPLTEVGRASLDRTDRADAPPPVTLEGRSFAGIYPISRVSVSRAASPPSPWQIAGSAGTGVGMVARKAGVGVATAVSRASVSLAKSF